MTSLENPVRRASTYRRALAANSGFVLLCVAVGGLSAELLQIWALEVLGYSPTQLGLTFGLMVVSIPVQLRAIGWVNRVGQQRAMRWGYLGIGAGLVAFQVVALLDIAGRDDLSFVVFLVSVVFIEVCVSCSWGTAWFSWVGELTTREDRPDFLRRMRLSTQVVYAVGVLSFTAVLGDDPRPVHFQALYLLLLAYVVAAYILYGSLPRGGGSDEEVPQGLRQAVGNRRLRFTLSVVLVQAFVSVPLVVSWLLIRGYPPFVVGLGSAVQSAVTIMSLLALRPALARWEPMRTLRVFGVASSISSILWLSLGTYEGSWSIVHYLVLLASTSTAASGLGVGWQAVLFDLMPEGASTAGFALSDLISSSAAQLYALGVGVVLGALVGHSYLGASGDELFKMFFLLGAAASLAVVLLAARPAQPSA